MFHITLPTTFAKLFISFLPVDTIKGDEYSNNYYILLNFLFDTFVWLYFDTIIEEKKHLLFKKLMSNEDVIRKYLFLFLRQRKKGKKLLIIWHRNFYHCSYLWCKPLQASHMSIQVGWKRKSSKLKLSSITISQPADFQSQILALPWDPETWILVEPNLIRFFATILPEISDHQWTKILALLHKLLEVKYTSISTSLAGITGGNIFTGYYPGM